MTTSWTSRARRAAIIRSASGLEPLSRTATLEKTLALYSVKAEFEMDRDIRRQSDGELSTIFQVIHQDVQRQLGIADEYYSSIRTNLNVITYSWYMTSQPTEHQRRQWFDALSAGLRQSGRSFGFASSWTDRHY